MCFTPLASIITAIIEFIIAAYIFYKIKDKRLFPIFFFVLLLGLYQLSEFMLCTTPNSFFWARVGFAVYTFLPMLIYHVLMNCSLRKINLYWYSIPAIFSAVALFYPNFIHYATCNTLNVTVKSLIFDENLIFMTVYLIYYFCFSTFGAYVLFRRLMKKKINNKIKIMFAIGPIAMIGALLYYMISTLKEGNQYTIWINTSFIIISFLLLTAIASINFFKVSMKNFYIGYCGVLVTTSIIVSALFFVIPYYSHNYSSIFCQFALLYALAALLLTHNLKGKLPEK